MMGGEGLTQATMVAILNANYIAARLKGAYDVLYTSRSGRVAHEMHPGHTTAGQQRRGYG